MELKDALKRLEKLDDLLYAFKDSYGNVQSDEFYHDGSPDEKQQQDIVRQVVEMLDEANTLLEWLKRPIRCEGPLTKNADDRYEVDGYELTSGHPLDYWDSDWEQWVKSRIEHNGEDYYIYALGREKPIEGIQARLREKL